jgi:monothiol glutaredoxin
MGSIQQISAPDLKDLMDHGASFEFVDVRTEDERTIARIQGSRLLDRAYFDQLMALDRNTMLVFTCHHGMRSQAAAEHFAREGFANVYNLVGGIDDWSRSVDPSIPRY